MAVDAERFDPNGIADALRKHVETWKPSVERAELGRVIEAGDGIARVSGLPGAMANELLEFPGGVLGLAFNLDVGEIGCIVLGDASHIQEGDPVKQTGQILSVPVGDGFLGRVVNALGEPIDDKGPVQSQDRRILEVQAPNVVNRQPVKEPLYTGITAIDAMTAIGRGQRELLIGDRQTGKTAVAVDAIIAQKELWATGDPKKRVKCIYVAVGQKSSTVAEVVATLEENGALEYTVVVNAPASDPAPFQYIAPYSGAAFGAHWMYNGEHALIVYDDLSKQATAYRTLSLLLRRPPGREAFPGDVFYLHSRLLERAAKLSDELGGGSLTALPIIETKGNDISAYIPTNVISITDGQIFLQSDLFRSGVRPAINVGISVSRVGGNAQITPMKRVAGRLKLELSQYRDLEAFAQFGSDLDVETQRTLARGERLVATLNQKERSPLTVEDQVVQVFAATNGFLDRITVERVPEFLAGLNQRMHSEHSDQLEKLREGEWGDELQEAVRKAVGDFADDFGYDLDEEGHPLEERQVGETTREAEGIRRRDEDAGEEQADAAEEKEEAAATA
jgi:F-type H+/Na+-transporting ATPase subunit alpha